MDWELVRERNLKRAGDRGLGQLSKELPDQMKCIPLFVFRHWPKDLRYGGEGGDPKCLNRELRGRWGTDVGWVSKKAPQVGRACANTEKYISDLLEDDEWTSLAGLGRFNGHEAKGDIVACWGKLWVPW